MKLEEVLHNTMLWFGIYSLNNDELQVVVVLQSVALATIQSYNNPKATYDLVLMLQLLQGLHGHSSLWP